MRETPRSRRGARHAPVWGLLAFLSFLSPQKAAAADVLSGNFAAPTGVVFDSGFQDRAQGVAVDASSNVYVAGYKSNASSGQDWVVLKLDPNGVLISSDSFDSAGGSSLDAARDILIAGSNIIVVGKAGSLRHIRVYNTSLQLVGTYQDGYAGVFNAVISSGTNLITSTLDGSQLLVNEFTTGAGLVIVATGTMTGSYLTGAANRNLVRSGGFTFVVGARNDTKVLRIEKLGANLALLAFLEFNEPDDIVAGAAVAATPGGELYSVAVGSQTTGSVNHIYRTAGVATVIGGTTVTANGFVYSENERAVVIDPNNLDVFYAGSGPFPGIVKFPSNLSVGQQKSFYPTSSMALLNGANMYATEVNQTGAQDYVVHKFDFNALSSGGGNAGQPALTNDGTSLYLSKKAGNGMVDLYKINPPSTLVASGTLSGVGANDNFPLLYKGGFLYMVGTASGPTTLGDDAGVWKVDPTNLLMVSSRTLDGSGGLGEYVMDATTTPNGLVLSGALETSPGTFSVAVWQYNTGTDALVITATANAPGSNFDFASGIASTGTPATFWLVGYSSQPVGGALNPFDVALWRLSSGNTLQLVNTLPGFLPDTENNPKITATSGGLFVSAAKMNGVPDRDLAFIAYDLNGSSTAEKYWHSSSPSTHDKSTGLLLKDDGSVVVFGGQEPNAQTGYSAYWEYSPAGVLTSGYPKTFAGVPVFYAGTKMGSTLWAANSGASTRAYALDGTGSAVPGAEGLVGAPAVPLTFSFSGGPATSLKINSNTNGNEAATFVAVDTTSAVFYLVWRSTSGPAFSTPDVASLGKFDFSGTLLASTALQGNVSGDAFLFAYGSLWLQEKDTATLRQYTKFDAGLNRLGSLVLNSNDVGNITNAVAANAVIYLACDGGSGANGGAKLIKVNTGLVEVARSTNAEYGPVHHNADGFMADAAGNLLVAVSTSEPGPARSLFKYDANLAVLSSANVTGLFPNKSPQLAYGGAGVVYALGENVPTAQMFLRRFDTGLGYSGQTATITVTGASAFGQLTTDPDRNALVALTTSSADGGDVLAFKFDSALVQLSSGQFDAGFNGADSGLAAVALSTAEVFLSAAGGNAGHTDAVVMRRSLPGAAAGGAGAPSTFSLVGVSFDPSGNLWDTNKGGVLTKRTSGGGFISSTTLPGLTPTGYAPIVFDGSGQAFVVANNGFGPATISAYKVSPAGALLSSAAAVGVPGNPTADVYSFAAATDAVGNVWFAGAVGNGPTWLGLWKFNMASGLLTNTTSYAGPFGGLPTEVGVGLQVDSADNTLWVLAYSSNPANPAAVKVDLALYHFDSAGQNVLGQTRLPGFLQDATQVGAGLARSGSALYAASKKAEPGGIDSLGFVKYSLAGATQAVRSWHNTGLGGSDVPNKVSIDLNGDVLISGTAGYPTGPATATLWKYSPAGSLLFAKGAGPGSAIDNAVSPSGEKWLSLSSSSVPYHFIVGPDIAGVESGGPPPPAVSSVTLAFTGTFLTGARAGNDAGGADIGHQILTVLSGGTTSVYVTIHSTSAPSLQTPDQTTLAKYDVAGAFLASATLQGSQSGDAFMTDGGFLYVAEKEQNSFRRLVKFDGSLRRLASVDYDLNAVGNITRGVGRGGFLYHVDDGGNTSNGAKVVKLDLNLNEVKRATYSFGAAHANGNAVVVTPNGEVFVSVTSSPTIKLVKYDSNLNALAEANVTSLFPGSNENTLLAFANGVLLAASNDGSGNNVLIRKFDPTLNYSGASATIPVQGAAPGFGLTAGPDGLFYLAITSYSADGGDFAIKVLDPDLVVKASTSFDAGFAGFDNGVGIAVADSSNVFVTGSGMVTGNVEAMTFVKNLSAAGAGAGGQGGQPGGFWGLTGLSGRIWAAQRGLEKVRRYDFPSPPVSRTTAFAQELGAGSGAIHPTALTADGGGNLWVSVSTGFSALANTRLVRYGANGGGAPGEVFTSTSGVLSPSLLKDVRALAYQPLVGDLWAAQGGQDPSIVKIARDGGSTLASPTYSNGGASTFTTTAQLPYAEALAFDSDNNLWVTARTQGRVYKYANLGGGVISQTTSQALLSVPNPGAIAFDGLGHMYVGDTTGAAPFTGKLWKFVNQGTYASPFFTDSPVQLQSGVDPTALAHINGQLWGSSDVNDQVAVHPTEPPVAPPSFGTISGSIGYSGALGGQLYIAFSTNPVDIRNSDSATLVVTTPALGGFSVATLKAPNTYYISALRDANANGPDMRHDPFGRYSTAFFGARTPVYLAADQSVSGVNVQIYDVVTVTGTVFNTGNQVDDLRVEPWLGAPDVGTLLSADTFMGASAGAVPYIVSAATITNLHLRAFVDLNHNRVKDAGEDSASIGPLNLSLFTPPTTTFFNITIGSSAAGQLAFAADSLVGPNIPTNGEEAFLRLRIWGEGGAVQFTGLRVSLEGDAPSPNVQAVVYKDANGDGQFQPGLDYGLGAGFFGGAPARANVAFFSTQTVTGSTTAYFVALRVFNLPAGKSVGVSLESGASFQFGSGGLAANQGPFPVASGLAVTQFALAAKPFDQGYPVPQGGASPSGGFDTGLFVNAGQRVAVNAQGTWNTGALGAAGPNGVSGQTGGLASGLTLGALVGRIGGSAWFFLGGAANFVATQSGPLALAMNDSDYNDNGGALAVDFQIVPSTVTRTWLGLSGFGFGADIPQNWQGGLIPQSGESVAFDGAVSTQPCDWNLYYANVGRFEMKNGYSGRVRLTGPVNPDDFNQLFVDSNALVASGTLDLGRNHELFVNGGVVVHGALDMGGGNSGLGAGVGVTVDGGGVFRFLDGGFPRVFSTAFGGLHFEVLNGTIEVRGNGMNAGLRFERPEGVLLSASANILAFDGAQFDQFDPAGSASALSIARSTAGVYVFRNLGFSGNLTKNIDAAGAVLGNSITLLDAIGTRRGTPYENDPKGVLNWVPDGGGAPASISGSVLNGGVSVGFSSSTVRVSTQPFFDPFAPQGGFSLQTLVPGGLGAYTLSNLDAPATYFLYAWGERGALGIPDGNQEPRGAYGNAGLFRSAPIFVAPGQNLTGADISLKDWGELQADISNASQQFGTILLGASHVNSTTTLESISFPLGTGFSPFLPAPATSVMLIGWIDVNNNRQLDGFEARGSSVVSLQAGSLVRSSIPVVIGGGSAPPGGTVGLAPSIPHAGLVGDVPPQAMMKLVLSGAGGASRLNGVRVDIADGPQQNYGLSAWVDGNGNGKLDPQCSSAACDFSIGSAFVTPPISSAVVNFYQPLDLPSGQSRTLFVAFEPFSLSAGHPALPPLGLSIAASNYFLMGAGSMNADPVYPVVSNAQIGWSVMAQTQGDSFGGGGYFTGVQVAAGQSVAISATGTWTFNGTTTDFRGIPGTEPQPTLNQSGRIGSVLASVGDGWVVVGTGVTITARFPAAVHLSANDVPGDYFNNEGYVTANIGVSGSTTSRVEGTITYTGGQTGSLLVNLIQDCQFAPTGCRPVLSTQTLTLAFGTTQYSYGLHIPFGGFFTVRAVAANDPSHRSGFIPNFQAPLGSTYTLNFPVFAGLGQITSTITYSGVMNFGEFRVGVTTTPNLEHGAEFFGGFKGPNAGPIVIGNLPIPNTYYIVGFRDGNFNQNPDGPEPFGGLTSVPSSQVSFADLASYLVPVFVSSTAHVAPIAMTDRGGISGRLFFQQAVPSGQAVISAAHGLPGSPGFAPESRSFRFISDVPANGSVDYFLGLLKPATDYTVFAFLDQNFNADYDAGEPFGQSAGGFVTVPSGGFANRDLTIGAPAAPPAVTGFGIASFSSSQTELRWDSTPGATGYLLLDASSATVVMLGGTATTYLELMIPSSTSAVRGIRAGNAQGLGPITGLPAGMVNASLAEPVAAPVLSNVQVSSLTVTWSAGTNGSLAKYQLERGSSAAGPFQILQFGTALSRNETGLAPSTQYFYRVKAQSPNGAFAAPSANGNATTLASGDSNVNGLVQYDGLQAGSVVVQLFTSSNPLAGLSGSLTLPPSAKQPYYIPVAAGSYFRRAFIDVDGNGLREPGEDASPISLVTAAVASGPSNFGVDIDTVTPGSPAGLRATTPFGRVDLTWNDSTLNSNGTGLNDRAGYKVQRTTAGTANFVTLSTGTFFGVPNLTPFNFFADFAPVCTGVDNVYRVVTVDWGRNESIPSGTIAVRPACGGTISGSVSSFTVTTAGAFRVRLSTSPRREDPFYAESTLLNFSFTGLSDGIYHLRVFRDVNADNQQDAATEPSGTHGGIIAPFPISITGGNTVSGRVVTACDRTALTPGQDSTGTLHASACPAADKGQGFFTKLHTFRVGGGAANSIGVGSTVDVSLVTPGFDSELIVLGPDGQVVARDNTPGNPHVHFPASQAGLYVVEPTSFLAENFAARNGYFDLLLNVFGGFQGKISGQTSYAGSKPGQIQLQLFDRPDSDAFPFFVTSTPSVGGFDLRNLRDGTFYLRAFRDANGNFAQDPGEPVGAYGASVSSPTAINVVGGVASIASADVVLADPSTGRIEGQILRQGSLAGTIRIEVGPRACNNCSDLNVVAFTTIAAAGPYALDFIAPATTYIVQAFVDGNANNQGDALEAKGSSSPITVAANSTSTVNVLVRDPGTGTSGSAVVFGTVTYTGASTGTVFIAFASDQNFGFIPYYLTNSATGFFRKSGLQGGTTYYVGAFIDANNNGTIDEDGAFVEPVGSFNGQLFVPNSSSVGVAFSIPDPSNGSVSGLVTYNGAIAGPLVVQAQLETNTQNNGSGGFRSVSIPRVTGVSSYTYSAGFLNAGPFRLYAFVDANGNQRSDFGEPFFRRESLVTVSSGTGGSPVTGINLLVLDAGAGGGGGAVGSIAGTFGYAGGQPGPVIVQLYSTNTFVGAPLRTVNASGGPNSFSFSFDNLVSTTYFVRAFKDSNFDQVLQPQFEANGLLAGGSALAVSNDNPFSGGHVGTLNDPGAGGGTTGNSISGEMQYRGAFTTGTFHITVFRDGAFGEELVKRSTFVFSAAPFSFTVSDLPQGQLYLRTFLDRNSNFFPDVSEPFGSADSQGLSVFGPVSGLIGSVCDRTPLDLTPGAQNAFSLNGGSCFSRESTTLGASNKLLTFRGTRGQTFDATASSTEDNYLYLYDQNGRLVASADEGGSKAGDARLVTVLPASGDYTLAAGFFAAGAAGDMTVTLQNSGGAPGSIAGEVRYTGSQGGRILTAIFNNPNFDAPGAYVDSRELLGPGAFSYSGLASETTYFMGAFVDVNFNRRPDHGEDFGVFSTAPPVATGIFLRSGQDLGGLLLEISASTAAFAGNEGQVTGQISYGGAVPEGAVLRVEFWAEPTFRGAPLAVRSVPTGVGPYDLSIAGGQPYFVRGFLDFNSDFVPSPNEPQGIYAPGGQGAEPVFVPSSGAVSGVNFELRDPGIRFGQTEPSGEGRVSLASAVFEAGGLVDSVTFTYVAEGRGIREGGVVVFGVPYGFPFPQTQSGAAFGYVSTDTVTNPGGVAPVLQVRVPAGAPAVEVRVLTSTPLYAGATVQLTYRHVPVPCGAFDLAFFAGSASTGTVPPSPLISGQPAAQLGAGQAASVRSAEDNIGLLQGATSQRLLLESVDACGNRVAVGANTPPVVLRAKRYNYATGAFDDTAGLRLSSSTTGQFVQEATVAFRTGLATATYRAVGIAGGDYFVEIVANLQNPGTTGYAALTVFANNSLSNVSVSTLPFQLGRTSVTITPNSGPTTPNQAFINFDLGDPTRFWTVSVASTPFKLEQTPEPVAFFSGTGQPARGQIAWDGRDFRGARVPRGIYYVRVDVGGLRDDSLRVTVDASQLNLKVLDSGVTPNIPLSDVGVESFGTLGGGAEFATDAGGELTLAGLGAGDYRLRFEKDGYLEGRANVTLSSFSTLSSMTAANANVALSSSSAGLLTVLMRRAPSLVIVPSIAAASTQPFTLWGSLQVENTTASFITNGPMRLPEGTTTFDDGGQWDPSLQQFVAKTILRFNVASGTYTVRATLPGFDEVSQSVFVGPDGQTTATLPTFAERSAFTGLVFLPANFNPAVAGAVDTFVSVSAVPITTTTALEGGFGGVSLRPGVDTAIYRVEGLRPGSYRLLANTQGLKAISIASATIVAGSDTTVDFSSFPVANTSVIVATIGVTGINISTFSGTPPGLHLNVSAWAPNSSNGFYQTIAVSTIGVSSQTVVVTMTGLDEGVQYQIFAGLNGEGNTDFDVSGGFPKLVTISTVTGRAALAFDFAAASGVIRGLIYLPETAPDFSKVDLYGETIASARPDQVGHTFTENALNLPGFAVGAAVNAASFTVTGVNTETDDITLTYRTTGRSIRTRLSVVNGQTTNVVADLREPTHKITGQIANQVTDPLFNTNQLIVVNAASVPVRDAAGSRVVIDTATVDLGGVGSVDSLARVLAIRQQFGVAASTNFNPATDRVGYLTTAGTYTIRNLTPGVYLLRTADIRACATCQVVIPRRVQTISVPNALTETTVVASSFTLADGFSVTGVISLKSGVQDARNFRLSLRNRRLEVVRSTGVTLGNAAAGVAAGSVSYRLDGVPAGEFYTLSVTDEASEPKYIGKPLSFPDAAQSPNGLQGSITGQDVLMRRAAYVTGKLKDAASGEIFSERNAKVLPPNLRIIAVANPWVEGGFAQAASSVANRPIRADGSFLVGPLFPEVSYDLKVFQDKWDLAFLAQGSQNYAPTGLSGLTMQPLERRDVGTLSLNQGTSIKGTLVDAASTTTALGNIRVAAKPSFGDVELNVETYSNSLGQFTLWVSTFVSEQYDVTVAPRDGNLAANGKRYRTVELPNFKVTETPITLELAELAVPVTGYIVTADSGALAYPFGDAFPAAAVFLQPAGVNPEDNPLGDISVQTDPDGFFTVPALSSGSYTIRAVSLGYGVSAGTVTVTAGGFCIRVGTTSAVCQPGLSLKRGGLIKGRISLPDGSAPSTDEIGGVAAANDDFTKFVVGTVDANTTNRTVSGYSITGFEPGVSYNIVLLPPSRDDADVIFPTEGQGVSFAAAESTTTKTINLTYTRIVPICQATAVEKAVGNGQFQVKITCTEPLLRTSSADDNVDKFLSVSSCVVNGSVKTNVAADCGSLLGGASKKIEPNRKQITAIYRAGNDNEESFTLKLDALMATVNPGTGDNFRVTQLFSFDTIFRAGKTGTAAVPQATASEEDRVVVSNAQQDVSNIQGGRVRLQGSERDSDGEQFALRFGEGSFKDCDAGDTDANCSGDAPSAAKNKVGVTVKGSLSATDAANRTAATLGYVPSRIQAMLAREGSFGVQASSSAKNAFGKSPLSTFYDIFLPLGVRSQLTKAVDLTLPYDLSGQPTTSISDLQIWSKSIGNIGKAGCTGQYCPENKNTRIDTVNKTVTVSVDHFSQFVVLNGPPALGGTATFAEQKPIAFNIPNPFDCRTRTVALNVADAGVAALTGMGTLIHYAAPGPVVSLDHRFRIYNVAGELVDEFHKTANGGTHNYDFWDCTNSSGRPVASGVYILEYTVKGQSVYHKMALIKGSGL